MNPITVLLADDHRIVREGLLALLKQEPDIHVVGEAENGRQAVALAGTLAPAVVLMDFAMPLLNGLEATQQILHAAPAIRVILLSGHDDDAYVERAMAMGAAGYLSKLTASSLLVWAIREVCKGGPFLGPSIAKRRHHRQRTAKAIKDLPVNAAATLTLREMEVLQLIAGGTTGTETADKLHISIEAVAKHRQRLMGKLNIHDAASLTRYAICAGIIESSVRVTNP